MSVLCRWHRLIVGLVVGLSATALAARPSERGFVSFVPAPVPQRAIGDFDGDGRLDVARIENGRDGRGQIDVGLSDESDAIRLDAAVVALVEEDIDHDGDLDLVTTTTSGDVVIWDNDGHGHFTPKERSQTRGFSSDQRLFGGAGDDLASTGVTSPANNGGACVRETPVAEQIRPPCAFSPFDAPRFLLRTPRAPPRRSFPRSPNSTT
jgi:hypothetical protein